MKDSTKRTNLLFLYLILAILALAIFGMLGAFSALEAGAAQRKTPTAVACETIVEGILRCPDGFATSVVRPNKHNVPIQATPRPKGARP